MTELKRQDPRWAKRWRVDRARGVTRLIPADRAAEHIRRLLAAGCSSRSIAEASGCGASTIAGITSGRYDTMQRRTEAKILAVTLADIMDRERPAGFVPNVGPRRRIEALLALGYRHQDITAAMHRHGTVHRSPVVLHQAGRYIAKSTADAVRGAYDELWSRPGPSEHTRTRAARLGYASPLAWDDDTIDDPKARPHLPRGPQRDPLAVVEDVEFLLATGTTLAAACVRLGMKADALEKKLYRAGRADLLARLKGLAA